MAVPWSLQALESPCKPHICLHRFAAACVNSAEMDIKPPIVVSNLPILGCSCSLAMEHVPELSPRVLTHAVPRTQRRIHDRHNIAPIDAVVLHNITNKWIWTQCTRSICRSSGGFFRKFGDGGHERGYCGPARETLRAPHENLKPRLNRRDGPDRPTGDFLDRLVQEQLVLFRGPPARLRDPEFTPALLHGVPGSARCPDGLCDGQRSDKPVLLARPRCRGLVWLSLSGEAAMGSLVDDDDLAAEPVDDARLSGPTHGLPFGPLA